MRRIRVKNILCFIFAVMIFPLILTSCKDSSAAESFMLLLGFDTHDYLGEEVTETHAPESDISLELAEMTRMLSISSPLLPVFSGAKEAVSSSRDAILNYMLNENYAKYTGNVSLLTSAAEKYPQYNINTLIPAGDFENIVYKAFGGNEKITHKDGKIFKYLDKADAYTSLGQPVKNEIEITVISCAETERTYRLTVKNKLDGIESPEYIILIIKRADGIKYIKSVAEK